VTRSAKKSAKRGPKKSLAQARARKAKTRAKKGYADPGDGHAVGNG
jgi:hypothetical protein